jgi:hypothetical protein
MQITTRTKLLSALTGTLLASETAKNSPKNNMNITLCKQTAESCIPRIATCCKYTKKAFDLITWPIRTIYHNKTTTVALGALGYFVYSNPAAALRYLDKAVSYVSLGSWIVSFVSGNIATYCHYSKKGTDIKKDLFIIAATCTFISTSYFSVFAYREIPNFEKKALIFIVILPICVTNIAIGRLASLLESRGLLRLC